MRQDHEPLSTPAPIAVVMISLNESHNMVGVLDNLAGFASEIFLVDSYSVDNTVDIALSRGVRVVQRRFQGFGDQWNFALETLPITAPWTMKLDPDERLSDDLKRSIRAAIEGSGADALVVRRRLWFMCTCLPVQQDILRVWRTGRCRFSDVSVNEHPIVGGTAVRVRGVLEHHDSPNLHHWFEKQNSYTTAEALASWRGDQLSAEPKMFGTALERRMWLKSLTHRIPMLPTWVFLHALILQGAWRAGRVGLIWAMLRAHVFRTILYKRLELDLLGTVYSPPAKPLGPPDPRVVQCD